MLQQKIEHIFQNRGIRHLLFWMLSFYVLFRLFFTNEKYFYTDWIYTFLFHISLFFVVYINLQLLLPLFFQHKKYLHYLLGFIITLGLGMVLNHLTFQYIADWLFSGYYFISYYEWRDILQFTFIYMALSSLLHLSKSWFDVNEKQKAIHRLEREKLDAALQSLKSQINPHFLFNSLNNLYALSLDSDKRLPDYLLRLSDNLRYMLYECKDDFVPLEKELQYIENYIGFQRLRAPQNANIYYEVQGEIKEQLVGPLLFIPFIENAFKFGLKGSNTDAYVHIYFKISDRALSFNVCNNKGKIDQMPSEHRGIGLENTRKRLDLLYPDRYTLKIEEGKQDFKVFLNISL
ncbi:MAG: histidine kinase [Saprospiraceae bacterium]